MTPQKGWLICAGITVLSMEGAIGVEALLKGENYLKGKWKVQKENN